MKNQYKRLDVFRCIHESHQGFGHVVSVYHVLKEKQCYPHGCIYFKWRCQKLNRGIACPKSYGHVGRKCTSCADYYDEKVVKRPQLLLSERDYQLFLKELKSFEMNVEEKKGKELNCAGSLKTVKPRFVMNHSRNRFNLSLQGFLLVFQGCFLDLTFYEETVYAIVSPSQQSRLKLSEGDSLEFRATLRLDRGRLILDRVHGIEIEEKNTAKVWTIAEARQALLFGKVFDDQYQKCLNCPHGSLVDVKEMDFYSNDHKRRKLLCLKGIDNPEYCLVQVKERLYEDDLCQDEERILDS